MQCIRCGFDLVDLAADCPQCGLSSASSPQSPAPEPTTELAPHFVAKHWRGLYPLAERFDIPQRIVSAALQFAAGLSLYAIITLAVK